MADESFECSPVIMDEGGGRVVCTCPLTGPRRWCARCCEQGRARSGVHLCEDITEQILARLRVTVDSRRTKP